MSCSRQSNEVKTPQKGCVVKLSAKCELLQVRGLLTPLLLTAKSNGITVPVSLLPHLKPQVPQSAIMKPGSAYIF
jgi:hypothetical protein